MSEPSVSVVLSMLRTHAVKDRECGWDFAADMIERLLPIAQAVAKAYLERYDHGKDDLSDEQPLHIAIPIGICRRAERAVREVGS